jgi:vitamin B12 transporter
VTATRTPSDPHTLGSVVDVLSAADLNRQQLSTLADALGDVAGVPAFANGAPGSDVSVFMRGADSNQTLFLVDGIRLNDANTDYAVFLGGARFGSTDTIEIARGPQSTLYGSEAIGGVIALRAERGTGAPTAEVQAEAGSFGSFGGGVSAQGTESEWAYAASASGDHTNNARANNAFDSGNAVVRLDRALSDAVAVGATVRGFVGRYGDPGDQFTNNLNNYDKENNWLGTLFADVKLAPDWTAHVILGGQDRRFESVVPLVGRPTSITLVENHRGVLDAQTTYAGWTGQRITAGVTGEAATTLNTGYGSIDRRQNLFAAFAEDEWHPLDAVYLTGGLRYDDFDTFGSATTGRITAAWLSGDRSFKVRGSYGTGFSQPSFLDLYGVATGYRGNPNLQPERAWGGDAGFDWYLPHQVGSFSATWFRTDYRNLIEYNFAVYPGTTVNVERARTDGIELEAKFGQPGAWQFKATYTYLAAQDLITGLQLLRRPRDSASIDLWREFGAGVSAGVGVNATGKRADVNALTYRTVQDPGYAVARLYAAWAVNRRLTLKARVENALNQKYAPVNGYPALGFGAFGGAEWKF